jgi:chromosome segregation ATPase
MFDTTRRYLPAFVLGCTVLVVSTGADAAASAGTGKIVCWKDKSGKVIGCGEYRESATKELDKRGVTRKTTESAEDAARRRALEQEQAQQHTEEQKRAAERKRQDTALMNTYTDEREIDAKRDRDLQVIELQINQLQTALKNATERESEAKARLDAAEKTKKPVPQTLKDDVANATGQKQKIEASIAAKKKEQEEIRKKYAEYRSRYVELKGAPAAPAAAGKK